MSGITQVGLAATFRSFLLVSLLWQLGCGDSRVAPAGGRSPAANISVAPASAAAGSPDVTLIVTATQQFSFTGADHKSNQVVWTANDSDTALATTFLGSSRLTAVVPAPLLANPLQAKVRVEVWDFMGDVPDATSSSVTFNVTTASTASPSPSIASISPASAKASSSDVTITITGSNFDNQFLHTSVAFWTINPNNLHDSGTMLHTTFVSSGQLSAVIPAALLQNPISVQVVVLTGDPIGMSDGFFGYPKSNSVTFTVSP
jgi:hypothetical protein